jgi:hypothetical protein
MPELIQKRGKKGTTFFVRYVANEGLKSTTIQDAEKRGAADILLAGKMTVLPPSVHPETGKPYTWSGRALLEAHLSDLPVLTRRKLDLIRLVLGSEHAEALTAGETTHDAGLRLTAQLLRVGCTAEEVEQIVRALLPPDYAGNSVEELPEWIRSARKKGFESRPQSPAFYDPGSEGPVALGFTKHGDYALRDQVRNIIITASAHQLLSTQWLIGLAPSSFWGARYPAEKRPFNPAAAGEALIAACKAKGPFNPARIRGRGFWLENGQVVANLGGPIPSGLKHQYLCFDPIPLDPAASFDTARLLELLKLFRWRNPRHAISLLGWLAIAPICGILPWRPHCFVYGPPKSGKSTLHTLASHILSPLAISTTGDSSEAGIRQSVGPDSLPVIIDEFESDQRRGRQQAIVMLARSASSGEVPVLRGTPEGKAMQFSLRVTFFFSGINPAGLSPADATRILLLELQMHDNDPEIGSRIAAELAAFADLGPSWCAYMASNALEIPRAKDAFEFALPGIDARLRTNVATILAGAFVALHGRAPTAQEAADRAADFAETIAAHADDFDRDDASECLHHLFAYVIDRAPVSHWLSKEANDPSDDAKRAGAQVIDSLDIVLRLKGEEPGVFLTRGSPGLNRIFEKTKWADGAWVHAIKKLPDAFVPKNPVYFPTMNAKARAIGIPLDLLPETSDYVGGGYNGTPTY